MRYTNPYIYIYVYSYVERYTYVLYTSLPLLSVSDAAPFDGAGASPKAPL